MNKLNNFFKTFVFLIFAVFNISALATETDSDDYQKIIDRIEQTKAKLKLTEEQEALLTPLMKENIFARLELLEKHGIELSRDENKEKPSFSKLRALGKDMKKLNETNNEKIAQILDSEQVKQYKKIQSENNKAMRKKILSR